MKQFYVVAINDDEFSLSWSPYIPTDVTGQRDLKKGDGIGEQRHTRGGGGGALRGTQYHKKNWQIPKYRVKNRRNTDTAFIFGHAYLKVYPFRVFVYLKHLCTSNQPQPLRGNVRRPRIDRYNDRKGCPTNFIIDYLSEIV